CHPWGVMGVTPLGVMGDRLTKCHPLFLRDGDAVVVDAIDSGVPLDGQLSYFLQPGDLANDLSLTEACLLGDVAHAGPCDTRLAIGVVCDGKEDEQLAPLGLRVFPNISADVDAHRSTSCMASKNRSTSPCVPASKSNHSPSSR